MSSCIYLESKVQQERSSIGATQRKAMANFQITTFAKTLPEILNKTKVDNLILQSPTNNISNISNKINNNGTVNVEHTNEVKNAAIDSSWTMLKLAEIAITKYPNNKK